MNNKTGCFASCFIVIFSSFAASEGGGMDIKESVKYWIDLADYDFETAKAQGRNTVVRASELIEEDYKK